MTRASHYKNRLVCGHRSWLSTLRPESSTTYCLGCGGDSLIISESVEGFAHPDRVVREAGKYGMKTP